jgi:hypothetical protein
MHYWGYVIESLVNDDAGPRSRRSRSSRRTTNASAREGHAWSRTAPRA